MIVKTDGTPSVTDIIINIASDSFKIKDTLYHYGNRLSCASLSDTTLEYYESEPSW